jgi:hypothetical protein
MLAAEFQASLRATDLLPQNDFRETHIAAEFAGGGDFGADRLARSPSTTLRVVPLPVPGRINGSGHHAAHPFFSIHA